MLRNDAISRPELWWHLECKSAPRGTVYNLTLATDPQQKNLQVADGTNNMAWILDRHDGTLVGSFAGNGRYAGQLHWIDSIAMDSKGNLYTGEVEDGKRGSEICPDKPGKSGPTKPRE